MDNGNCCTSLVDLEHKMRCDPVNMPVIESAIRNIHSPISCYDAQFLLGLDSQGTPQPGVDLFQNQMTPPIPDPYGLMSVSYSAGVIKVGYRFRNDFLLDSLCFVLRCPPRFFGMRGNLIHTQARVETFLDQCQMPYSPENLIGNDILAGSRLDPLTRYKAHLEVGSPQLRAAHWALEAYRVTMQCPSSPGVHEILDQRLVDIGNCCLGPDYEGWGANQSSWLLSVRAANKRLHDLFANNAFPTAELAGQGQEVPTGALAVGGCGDGYFFPYNSTSVLDQSRQGGYRCDSRYLPYEDALPVESYGAADVSGSGMKWFRLAIPRPIRHDENVEIILKIDPSDRAFMQKMLLELAYQPPVSPVMNHGGCCPVILFDDGSYSCYGNAAMARIPFGTLRFGVAMRGLMLNPNLCSDLRSWMPGLSYDQWIGTNIGASRHAGNIMVGGGRPMTSLRDIAKLAPGCGSCG